MIQLPHSLIICNKEYKISKLLGQGAYGRVLLAENNNILYAIKQQECIQENEMKFYQTILGKQKTFRNLINIFAIEKIGRFTYIVMEQAESSLFEQIEKNTFPKHNIRYVMKEIANGIKELHDCGLTHRDIKPENVLIKTIKQDNQEQQIYKICDFGTIKESARLETQNLGTPYYIAPEQISDKQYTNKVDIWAFGAMCYELLTGQVLFNGFTVKEIEKQIKELNVKDKINQLSKLDEEYKNLLLLMLDRDVNKRCDINYVVKLLGPKSRSASRNKSNQNLPQTISIRNNNYFNIRNRSNSGFQETENTQIKIENKSPLRFQPNYNPPPRPLIQDNKYINVTLQPNQNTQTNTFNTLQSKVNFQDKKFLM